MIHFPEILYILQQSPLYLKKQICCVKPKLQLCTFTGVLRRTQWWCHLWAIKISDNEVVWRYQLACSVTFLILSKQNELQMRKNQVIHVLCKLLAVWVCFTVMIQPSLSRVWVLEHFSNISAPCWREIVTTCVPYTTGAFLYTCEVTGEGLHKYRCVQK